MQMHTRTCPARTRSHPTLRLQVTGDVGALPTIMLALAVASAIATRLCEDPLDDILIHLTGLPYLHEEPPKILDDLVAQDVASPRVTTLSRNCTVRAIVEVLDGTTHNGVPVVTTEGAQLCGLLTRQQLLVLLHERAWEAPPHDRRAAAIVGMFHAAPPVGKPPPGGDAASTRRAALCERFVSSHRYDFTCRQLKLTEPDLNRSLDLGPYMDPAPPLVFGISPLPQIYHLFNRMGYRHVLVIDAGLKVVGIITRKDTFPELVERRLVANFASSLMCSTRRSFSSAAAQQQPTTTPAKAFQAGAPATTSRLHAATSVGSSAGLPPTKRRRSNRWQAALDRVMGVQKSSTFSLAYASVLAVSPHGEGGGSGDGAGGAWAGGGREAGDGAEEGDDYAADYTIAHILATSFRNNPPRGIGGMLYYERQTQSIVQVLEGPEAAVRSLFATILSDPRHHGCEVLREQFLPARQHASFGMALTEEVSQLGIGHLGDSIGGLRRSIALAGGGDHGDSLLRLQYKSKLDAEAPEAAQAILKPIIAASIRNNSRLRIGGLLSFDPSTMQVVQVLEGPEAAVRSLYHEHIARDSRHRECELLDESPIASEAERMFGGWGLLQEMHSEADGATLATGAAAASASPRKGATIATPKRLLPTYDVTAAKAATKRIADAAETRRLIEDRDRNEHVAPPRRAARWVQRRLSRESSKSSDVGDKGAELTCINIA